MSVLGQGGRGSSDTSCILSLTQPPQILTPCVFVFASVLEIIMDILVVIIVVVVVLLVAALVALLFVPIGGWRFVNAEISVHICPVKHAFTSHSSTYSLIHSFTASPRTHPYNNVCIRPPTHSSPVSIHFFISIAV